MSDNLMKAAIGVYVLLAIALFPSNTQKISEKPSVIAPVHKNHITDAVRDTIVPPVPKVNPGDITDAVQDTVPPVVEETPPAPPPVTPAPKPVVKPKPKPAPPTGEYLDDTGDGPPIVRNRSKKN